MDDLLGERGQSGQDDGDAVQQGQPLMCGIQCPRLERAEPALAAVLADLAAVAGAGPLRVADPGRGVKRGRGCGVVGETAVQPAEEAIRPPASAWP